MLSFEEVQDLSKNHQVIPLVKKVFSDSYTPIEVFDKLAMHKHGSFLLESAENGIWARYSFVGIRSLGVLEARGSKFQFFPNTDTFFPKILENPDGMATFDFLDSVTREILSYNPAGFPPLLSGLVGFMSWDSVSDLENLGEPNPKDFDIPKMAFSVIKELVILDHQESNLYLVSNIFVGGDLESSYRQSLAELQRLESELTAPSQPFLVEEISIPEAIFNNRTPKSQFMSSVEKVKTYIEAGDAFQVVLSQRFDIPVEASPLSVYRVLRTINPSPYMYLLNFDEFSIVGSSPEALVRVSNGSAVMHPIAGSRPRGNTPETDNSFANELVNDEKEKAEHLMLVDLARNDLIKVCDPSSVTVTEFMTIEKYSSIMHLVSSVEGKILPEYSAVDVVRATFPAGTLSGAPKPRALEIIEEIEEVNRGLFGGVVGYLDFAGNADLAIAIRTAVLRDKVAYIQAGAGIVLDSNPENEYAETQFKASATIRAVLAANGIKKIAN